MANDADRIFANIEAIVRSIMAEHFNPYLGFWEFTVTSFDEATQTADLTPTVNKALPPLTKIPVRLPAMQSKLGSNSSVLVGFANGDPAKPFIAHLNQADTYTGALAQARQGDMTNSPVTLLGLSTLFTTAAAGLTAPPLTAVGAAFTVLAQSTQNAYALTVSPPPPPPFVPNIGGPTSIYGTVSSGSVVNKSK